MKKPICFFLAITMVFIMCACSQKETETQSVEVKTDVSTVAPEIEVEDDVLKFGLICLHDENSTYDSNFIHAFEAACEAQGVDGILKTNIPETNECYEAAADLVDKDCKIIFADSFGHESFILQAAKEFPAVQFCHATGTNAHTEKLSNFHNAFASIYEGRYLAGVAAGMKLKEMIENNEISSESVKVGYIGAFTYAEVISGYTAWFLGVKSIVPNVTMEVQFTGSWYDEALEKEAANTLIKNGCVLISQHADSMGAPTACEEAKIPNVSYNGSTVGACPNTFIVSSKINWQPYFEYIIECVKAGEAIDTDWVGSLSTGSVELTALNENVAAKDTMEKLEEVVSAFSKNELHVFDTSTFTVDNKIVDSYLADIDSDAEYTGDTEVIIDGYFHESEFRSAPYFDLAIDGIKILNAMY